MGVRRAQAHDLRADQIRNCASVVPVANARVDAQPLQSHRHLNLHAGHHDLLGRRCARRWRRLLRAADEERDHRQECGSETSGCHSPPPIESPTEPGCSNHITRLLRTIKLHGRRRRSAAVVLTTLNPFAGRLWDDVPQSGTSEIVMKRWLAGMCMVFLLLGTAWSGPAEEAAELAQRGDHVGALQLLNDAAGRGDPDAQALLGSFYVYGMGVPRDDAQALAWYRKAAEQGHLEGYYNVGVLLQNGRGTAKDLAAAAEMYRRAAELGHTSAAFNLGVLYADGEGVARDDARALQWFRKAAEAGHAGATGYIGTFYLNGRVVPKDDVEAFGWFSKAAQLGDARAQTMLSVMLASGRGTDKDVTKAVEWLAKAAVGGNPVAQRLLGARYLEGDGVEQNDAEALRWFTAAAERGDWRAQSTLGRMHYSGQGVPKDVVQAQVWLTLAATQEPRLSELRDRGRKLLSGHRRPKSTGACRPGSRYRSRRRTSGGGESGHRGFLVMIAQWRERRGGDGCPGEAEAVLTAQGGGPVEPTPLHQPRIEPEGITRLDHRHLRRSADAPR
jgi:TPR repeat protein